jgi:hypothetical protein
MWGTENVILVAIGGFSTFLACVAYMLGGTSGFGLWWRRFLGVFFLGCGTNLVAGMLGVWVWPYLLFFPLLGVGMSLGYGADTTIGKIIKRTIFALGVLSCCVIGMWVHTFSIFSIVIGILALLIGLGSIVLGVVNPFNNAPVEQYLICQVLTLFVPFWGFVR